MAVYKIFPFKDTSLYSLYPNMNTGIDPINQVSNLNFALLTSATVARTLIEFSSEEIVDLLDGIVSGYTWDTYFRSYIATAQGIVETSTIEVRPVAESWNNGTGTYLDSPLTTDGIEYAISQTFGLRSSKDLKVNTTTIVSSWYSASSGLGGIENNGFIIKWEDAIEFNPNKQVQPVMQYYSVDTNTIYPPELEFRWDDSSWDIGSSTIPELLQPNCFVSLAENPGVFLSESINIL